MNANLKEIADGTKFEMIDVINSAVRLLSSDQAAAISYITWNWEIRHTYHFVIMNGKVYVSDNKQQIKPVAFYNTQLPLWYPEIPLLDAVTGKAFIERLNDAIVAYHHALDITLYTVRFTYAIAATYQLADQEGMVHSCMSGDSAHYHSTIHPCKVYEKEIDRKVMLAYMLDHDGMICARTLCDMSEGISTRIYFARETDRIVFIEKLAFAGIDTVDATLANTHYPVIHDRGGAVFPYLDRGELYINDDETKFAIFDHAPIGWHNIESGSTSGIIYLSSRVICDSCGDYVADDETTYIHGETICDSCREQYYSWSEYVGDYIHNDNAVYSEYLSDYIPSDDAIYSESLADYILESESVEGEITIDGGTIISDYFPADYDQAEIARMLAANVETLNTNRRRRRAY